MRQSIAILAALASSVCAQNLVIYIPTEGGDGNSFSDLNAQAPVATINSVNPSTTEITLACPTGMADPDSCPYDTGIDYTIISQTRFEAVDTSISAYYSMGCDYNSQATAMTCTINDGSGPGDNSDIVTMIFPSNQIAAVTASVVQGASLLSGGASASTTQAPKTSGSSAASTSMTTSASASASGSAASKSQASASKSQASASASGATSTGSAAPAQHTGAAVRFGIEGSALLALAGAAAMNVF